MNEKRKREIEKLSSGSDKMLCCEGHILYGIRGKGGDFNGIR